MPNITIPGFKDHMDGAKVGYTINSDNVVTISGNVSAEGLENLIRAARASGFRPFLSAGALKFTLK